MKSVWGRALLALIPFGIGVLVSVLLTANVLPNMLLRGTYAVDLAWLVSRGGLLISALLLIGVGIIAWLARSLDSATNAIVAEQATERRRFLQRLDHEIKNPLTIMRLGTVNLQHSPNFTEEQKNSLERIAQQSERLQKLMLDLRWLGEIEEHEIEQTRLNPAALIQEAIDTSSPEWRDRQIEIHIQEIPWPVGDVLGDGDLLVAALRNLLDNALKFTERGGLIEVRATDDGHTVTLEVADNGMGIPADEVPHVFEELYRGQQAKRISGSGLGLTLVQKIIALHHGTIDVRSREGRGTALRIRLPLAPSA
jgi:two-component system, OmpR family, sensor kinase